MPKIAYSSINLRNASLAIIEQANQIITEYSAEGMDLTLRQLFYQFVSRGLIPNKDSEYKKLGETINNARLAGLIDWDTIVDRTRFLRRQSHWENPEHIVESCASSFRLDKWKRQSNYVEVWIEKDALLGVIEDVCIDNDTPYMACRGYASASEIWRAGAQRFLPKFRSKKRCIVLYLGDHDPSGIDMTRDVQERLNLFMQRAGAVKVKRIALNFDQVQEYNPPPNPTKMTDSRATNSAGTGYYDKFGQECWELDALNPTVIRDLIAAEIAGLRNDLVWEEAVAAEAEFRRLLTVVSENWQTVIDSLE